jgi:hypothetical protein
MCEELALFIEISRCFLYWSRNLNFCKKVLNGGNVKVAEEMRSTLTDGPCIAPSILILPEFRKKN